MTWQGRLGCSSSKLSKRLGSNVYLKRKDLQPVFLFKLRGAHNMMAKLPRSSWKEWLSAPLPLICSPAAK
ncbi:hypothetical protein MLD38_035418 [Melastoma candidum]|uniref:Uncharacterized protein n=1 Tax=Melastoma candidum TaxID=119954 RepID=A0ACB9LGL6_9MYRT|nr:hypothetical protein MLD38_035418 [Melastoma candidum]